MTCLALDISLKTGYAFDRGGSIQFGTRDFEGLAGNDCRVGQYFGGWVEGLIETVHPEIIAIERPFLRHQGPTRLLFGLVWEASIIAYKRGIPVVEYAPVSIKKFITGNGKAKKPEVIAAVRQKGYKVTNDDEGDAVALLLLHKSRTKEKLSSGAPHYTMPMDDLMGAAIKSIVEG